MTSQRAITIFLYLSRKSLRVGDEVQVTVEKWFYYQHQMFLVQDIPNFVDSCDIYFILNTNYV